MEQNEIAGGPPDTGPGRLKVLLGAAPGLGKTYRMLDAGRRRAHRGTDVAVAFAECRGRLHTEQMLGGLETVPRARRRHQGSDVEELDLDAVPARRPRVALVDGLAHTNVPGGRNAERWQDIDELPGAGIDVVSTITIHHLESLPASSRRSRECHSTRPSLTRSSAALTRSNSSTCPLKGCGGGVRTQCALAA